jgi:hypothetical protein
MIPELGQAGEREREKIIENVFLAKRKHPMMSP